ncbi:hypothetical protein ACS0TY_028549 [Phlomoides rotata]
MGSDSIQDSYASIENVGSGEVEAESNNIDSLEVVSSGGDTMRELESAAEVVTRIELDIACSSEKLLNLDILVLHVASRGNDFEAFISEEEHTLEGSDVKALEFDLLYGFLDSEVRELESVLSAIKTDIFISRDALSSIGQLGDMITEMEDRLQNCEDSLKKSFEQVTDIKMQSANFRILLASSGKDGNESSGLGNGSHQDFNAKIKMQTAEQKRSILRMLEKSLGREIDLEKRLTESRELEEDLKQRLEQEVFFMEQEAEDMWGRLFEAENSAEILLGVSKELYGQIQVAHFSINGSIKREGELRSKLQDFSEQLKEKDCALQCSENSRTELDEKVNSLEKKLREFESQVKNSSDQSNELKEKSSEAEKRAEIAESECKLLRASNMEFNTELSRLKNSITDKSNRVEQLERQLKESEMKGLHAVASAEASEEKQIMLDCTIKDMENLIKDLKSKVLRAENQTESAEEKCIILSESNAELHDEINFLRHRMEQLETSLHQADETKNETAKDIRLRTKLITDLVLQLALERERLHKQISSLTKEKSIALKYLQQMKDPSTTVIGNHDAKVKDIMLSENDTKNETPGKESNEDIMESTATNPEMENSQGDSSTTMIKSGNTDSSSELESVRNIDARQLGFKHVFMIVVVILVIPAFAAFLISAATE